MKSVYIAGQYARRDELRIYQHSFLGRNIHVTSRWLMEDAALNHSLTEFDPEWKRLTALKDYWDIQRADTLIFFAEEPEQQPRRGGRHVEFGMALALGKKVLVVGGEENIFHYMPQVKHYSSFEQLIGELDVKQ
jgi:hypothetical protein